MVSLASVQEYSKRVGKSGQVLGEQAVDVGGIPEEVWNNPTLLKTFIESTKLQKDILSIECKKTRTGKKEGSKSC